MTSTNKGRYHDARKSMKFRSWILTMAVCFAFCHTGDAAESQRPNIVFFMADDWPYPHAGILGDPVVQTPNFDRVAREEVLFENAFVSTPFCTSSRLSILTGQHHWRLQEGASLGGHSGKNTTFTPNFYRMQVILLGGMVREFGRASTCFGCGIHLVKSFVRSMNLLSKEKAMNPFVSGMEDKILIVLMS
jgi:hypothetical protein